MVCETVRRIKTRPRREREETRRGIEERSVSERVKARYRGQDRHKRRRRWWRSLLVTS